MTNNNEGLVGSYLGRYKIEELVGRGGMAEVYKATQVNLDRFVAIKVMHRFLSDDRDFLNRFEREARVMAKIRHPNIVHVHDYEVHDDYYYIVMDYLSGGTLKNLLDKIALENGVIDLARAAQVTLEIGEALAYAHNIGMVHRDIKPANIMFDEKGIAVLTDFGIARMVGGTTHTTTGSMIGTPAYMSPEQGLGESGNERSDIYSLGVLAYHLFTGRLPFEGETPLSVVLKHVNENPPLLTSINPDIPESLEKLVLKAMDKNPDLRWNSVLEMNQEIRNTLKNLNLSDEDATSVQNYGSQEFPTPAPSLTVPDSEHDSLAMRASKEPVQNQLVSESATILASSPFHGEFDRAESQPQMRSVEHNRPTPQTQEVISVDSQPLLPDLPAPTPDHSPSANPVNFRQEPPNGPISLPPDLSGLTPPAVDEGIDHTPEQADEPTPPNQEEYSDEMSSFLKGFDKGLTKEKNIKLKPEINPLVKKARRRKSFSKFGQIIKGVITLIMVVAGVVFGIYYVTRLAPEVDVQGQLDDLLDNPDASTINNELEGLTADNLLVTSPFSRNDLSGAGIVLEVSNLQQVPARWVAELEYYAEPEDDGAESSQSVVDWVPVDGKKVSFDSNGEIAWPIDDSFPTVDGSYRWILYTNESSNEKIAISEEFSLPANDEILEIIVSTN